MRTADVRSAFFTFYFAFPILHSGGAAEPADRGYPAAELVSPLDQQRVAALSMACLHPRVSWHLTPIAIRYAGTSACVGVRDTSVEKRDVPVAPQG